MPARVRSRLTFANVTSVLALFVALGGTAYAVNTIGSDDVIDNSLVSQDIKNETIRGGDIAPNTIGGGDVFDGAIASADVKNETLSGDDIWNDTLHGDDIENDTITAGDVRNDDLTGTDIKDKSGVDTCHPATLRFDDICAGGPGVTQVFYDAVAFCAGLNLRLPTYGEAQTLATNHDVPGVGPRPQYFWTDELWVEDGTGIVAIAMAEDGRHFFNVGALEEGGAFHTVCVTTPTN